MSNYQNHYLITAQFVSGKDFDGAAKAAVKAGINYYNSSSLLAKNPKQISSFSYSDEKTLTLTLESAAALPMPTKALRLLSSYLVENTCLSEYLAGKQLFKMTASKIAPVTTPLNIDKVKIALIREKVKEIEFILDELDETKEDLEEE